MRLSLKNVGKIAQADIELNGITVIAGENDTGKSTISRALFCAFNSLYQIDQKVFRAKRNSIERELESSLGRILFEKSREMPIFLNREKRKKIPEEIIENKNNFLKNKEFLKSSIYDFYLKNNIEIEKKGGKKIEELELKKISDSASERIFKFISVPDEKIFLTLTQRKFNNQFNNQINNIYFPDEAAEIKLIIKNKDIVFSIDKNELNHVRDAFSLQTEAIYIDDPFVLDVLGHQSLFSREVYSMHQNDLKKKLVLKNEKFVLEEIVTEEELSAITEKINSVCNGEMVEIEGDEFVYKRKDSDAVLDITNISAGLKTFVILKTLLMNGSLEEKGTLILDEPEIHLHPAWQLIYAELIVLIQKEFGMHILLNTHSPYFLNAIEVYAARHGIADKCKYYLAENSDSGAVFTDVSGRINEIYKKLARPFQDLENERYPND